MSIRVYNTMSGKKETFEPMEPGKVKMYVCGPTVYDACHIGHARSVVVFDVITRYLRAVGYEVLYVRNFTDIDDKIINRAQHLNISTEVLAKRYIEEFYSDMDALNAARPTREPKATDHIDDIITVIERLMDKGLAYTSGRDVYFAVDRFNDYGKLSGRKPEDMIAGARVEVDPGKRNPLDFVLWKSAKPGEPKWESPWGEGRPGWHIECSAMSSAFLGETFDIHGGGKDLIFPHHENEIAQSEGAFGKPFARYWIHNGFVNIDKEKMSKSLNNFLMIKDAIKSYHPEAVRLFLLSNHYRSPIDYSQAAMEDAGAGLDRLYTLIGRLDEALSGMPRDGGEPDDGDTWKRFRSAMDDDFNTAQGIGILFDAARTANRILDEAAGNPSEKNIRLLQAIRNDIERIGSVLGILSHSPDVYFDQKKNLVLEKEALDPAEIERLISERNTARKQKEWAKADGIRQTLAEKNIILEDRPDGTIWKVKD
ncbi:MAG: cysteine--tRNA ligase [Desulfobacterales bacterium]